MRNSFTFFRSYYEAIQDLTEEDRLKFYEAIMSYMFNDQEPKLKGISKIIYMLIQPTLKKSKQNYENGKNGGAPKGNQNALKRKTTEIQAKNNRNST